MGFLRKAVAQKVIELPETVLIVLTFIRQFCTDQSTHADQEVEAKVLRARSRDASPQDHWLAELVWFIPPTTYYYEPMR